MSKDIIENKIRELWKKRGFDVRSLSFKILKDNQYQWTIVATTSKKTIILR